MPTPRRRRAPAAGLPLELVRVAHRTGTSSCFAYTSNAETRISVLKLPVAAGAEVGARDDVVPGARLASRRARAARCGVGQASSASRSSLTRSNWAPRARVEEVEVELVATRPAPGRALSPSAPARGGARRERPGAGGGRRRVAGERRRDPEHRRHQGELGPDRRRSRQAGAARGLALPASRRSRGSSAPAVLRARVRRGRQNSAALTRIARPKPCRSGRRGLQVDDRLDDAGGEQGGDGGQRDGGEARDDRRQQAARSGGSRRRVAAGTREARKAMPSEPRAHRGDVDDVERAPAPAGVLRARHGRPAPGEPRGDRRAHGRQRRRAPPGGDRRPPAAPSDAGRSARSAIGRPAAASRPRKPRRPAAGRPRRSRSASTGRRSMTAGSSAVQKLVPPATAPCSGSRAPWRRRRDGRPLARARGTPRRTPPRQRSQSRPGTGHGR